MAKEWTAALSVGIAQIDEQHKQLFQSVNELLAAMSQGKATQKVGEILNFLAQYATSHFATEERLMARYNYPHLEAHRLQHRNFVQDFVALKQRFDASGANTVLVLEIHRKASDWLVNHIQKTDKLMGTFVASKMTATAGV